MAHNGSLIFNLDDFFVKWFEMRFMLFEMVSIEVVSYYHIFIKILKIHVCYLITKLIYNQDRFFKEMMKKKI